MQLTRYLSRFAANEVNIEVRPSYGTANRYPAIYVHGSFEGADGFTTIAQRWPMFRVMEDCGCVVSCDDLGGPQTWGNATAMQRLDSVFSAIQSLPGTKAGKVILFCQSMGFLNAFAWAKLNPGKVACIVALIPVMDINDMMTKGYDPHINAAYSPGGWSQATYGASKNPLTIARNSASPNVPMQIWYGSTDTACPPALTTEFCTLTGAQGHIIAGGHAEDTLLGVDYSMVKQFILANGG